MTHDYKMRKEILEQPGLIKNLVDSELENIKSVAAAVKERKIRLISFVARGTSDHAAIYGKYILEIFNGFPCAFADHSAFTVYDCKLDMTDTFVIGISQSGESTDVVEYLQKAKKMGAMTCAVTNEAGSSLTKGADFTVYLHAGKEYAVAATKTYTTSLAVMWLLSCCMSGDYDRVNTLLKQEEYMKKALELEDMIADRAERYRYMTSGTTVGRGLNFATAMESGLKLAEVNHVVMRAFSAADLKHGPISAIKPGDPVFLVAPTGKAFECMRELAEDLTGRGAELIVLSDDEKMLSMAALPIRMEHNPDEAMTPLSYIIPSQLFSYHLALAHGFNPDEPVGLTKITLTR